VKIHDVTLKDEKLEIALALDELGVDRIEAGLPAVYKDDKSAIKEIAKQGLKAKVFSFCRCITDDVDLARECDVDGVVMEIPASLDIIKRAYQWSPEKALELSVKATSYARKHGLNVTFFTIDSTRADFNWWYRMMKEVMSEGHMDALAVVDTFGVCSPEAASYFVTRARRRFTKPIEAHFHNDFGLGVANTVSAVSAGASVVHTTINGIGERVGNTTLDEVVLSLECLYGVKTSIKKENFCKISKLVERLSGIQMPKNKPVVGENIYNIESGIVAAWWQNVKDDNPLVMFPFHWSMVGHYGVNVFLGKKNGLDSIGYYLKKMNLSATSDQTQLILARIKDESVRAKGPLDFGRFLDIVEECGVGPLQTVKS
jgi:isopropylmalate/homocitrate/citramalate synthase